MLELLKKDENYEEVEDGYKKLSENEEGSRLFYTIEVIYIRNIPFGDMGARILGLELIENTKLLYLVLSMMYKE